MPTTCDPSTAARVTTCTLTALRTGREREREREREGGERERRRESEGGREEGRQSRDTTMKTGLTHVSLVTLPSVNGIVPFS
jgi:hypothetical protein